MTIGPSPDSPYIDKNWMIALLVAMVSALMGTGLMFATSTVNSLSATITTHESRLASIESKNAAQDAVIQQLITDMGRRLDRIENKLDNRPP